MQLVIFILTLLIRLTISGPKTTEICCLVSIPDREVGIVKTSQMKPRLWSVPKTEAKEVISSQNLASDKAKKPQKGVFDEDKMQFSLVLNSIKKVLTSGEDQLDQTRSYLGRMYETHFEQPTRILSHNMVFGGQIDSKQLISHQLEVIGMQHVTAASGYNLSLVLNFVNLFLKGRTSRRTSRWVLGGGLVTYFLVAARSPSLVRALVMAVYGLLARYWFLTHPSVLWSLVVTVMLVSIFDPKTVTSISFQLSVSASLGILCLFPLVGSTQSPLFRLESGDEIESHGHKKSLFHSRIEAVKLYIRESFWLTISAQLFTFPVLLYHFHEVSWLSLPANILIGWLVPLITLSSLLFSIVCIAFLPFPVLKNLLLLGLSFVISFLVSIFTALTELLIHFDSIRWHTTYELSRFQLLVCLGVAMVVVLMLQQYQTDQKKLQQQLAFFFRRHVKSQH